MAEANQNNANEDAVSASTEGAETTQPADGTAQKSPAESSTEVATEAALNSAEGAAKRIKDEADQLDVPGAVDLPEFKMSSQNGDGSQDIGLLADVALNVTIELGRTKMYVEDVLRLNSNSIVELDKAAGDPVDIYVNGCHVARGEVLVLNENFCVRVSEIISTPARSEKDGTKN